LEFLLSLPKPLNLVPFSLKFFPEFTITREGLHQGLVTEQEVRALGALGHFEMVFSWYAPRKQEDLFWNCLFLLSSRSTFPRVLVKIISRNRFLKKKTGLLVLLVKMNLYPELFFMGIRRISRGQIKLLNVAAIVKGRLLRRTI